MPTWAERAGILMWKGFGASIPEKDNSEKL
jgi:hypothetical protein